MTLRNRVLAVAALGCAAAFGLQAACSSEPKSPPKGGGGAGGSAGAGGASGGGGAGGSGGSAGGVAGGGGSGGGGGSAGGSPADAIAPADGAGGSSPPDAGGSTIDGVDFFQRLPGLWSGRASPTPVGDIQVMNVDFRNVGGHFLFGQMDMDAGNNLRFGFSIETYDGKDVLAYRNGGYFAAILRDSRTRLIEWNPQTGFYRFCSVKEGCAYIDASFTFASADQLTFDVKVRGRQHVLWTATRREARTVPRPFPETLQSQGDGSKPWPAMAGLAANVSWSSPVATPPTVWLQVTSASCAGVACTHSRMLIGAAKAGDTTTRVTLPNVHAGSYMATVLKNGAAVAQQAVTIGATGETTIDVRTSP